MASCWGEGSLATLSSRRLRRAIVRMDPPGSPGAWRPCDRPAAGSHFRTRTSPQRPPRVPVRMKGPGGLQMERVLRGLTSCSCHCHSGEEGTGLRPEDGDTCVGGGGC